VEWESKARALYQSAATWPEPRDELQRAHPSPRFRRYRSYQRLTTGRRFMLDLGAEGRLLVTPVAQRVPPVAGSWMSTMGELWLRLWPEATPEMRDDLVDFLARWVRLGWLADTTGRGRPGEDVLSERYPPHLVLIAYVFYFGQTALRVLDGQGFQRVLRSYDAQLVDLFATQRLQRLVFNRPADDPEPNILGAEEERRAADRRHNQQKLKRRRSAKGLDVYSSAAQKLHFAPSSRLTMSALLPIPVATSTEEPTTAKKPKPRPDQNPFACTLTRVHEMRDRLRRLLGIGGGRRDEFTATFYLYWFRDESLRCWPQPPHPW